MSEQFNGNMALRVDTADEDRYAPYGQQEGDPCIEQGQQVVVLAAQEGGDVYLKPSDIPAFRAMLKGRGHDAEAVESITARKKDEGPTGHGCPACHGGFVPVMHSPLQIMQQFGGHRSHRTRLYVHQHCRSRLRVDLEEAFDHPDLLLGDAL